MREIVFMLFMILLLGGLAVDYFGLDVEGHIERGDKDAKIEVKEGHVKKPPTDGTSISAYIAIWLLIMFMLVTAEGKKRGMWK
jgi:hypothetical protein